MAAPADGSTTTPPPLVRMKKPLSRAIQLVMAIIWSGSKSSCTTTTPSTKTIRDLVEEDRRRSLLLWINFVFLPSMYIASAAGITYAILSDGYGRELVSGTGGFCLVAIPVLLFVYYAVLHAAVGHLALFTPQTPVAAWEAFHMGMSHEPMGFIVMLISLPVMVLKLIDQAWPLLVAWTCLLGLLVASIIALWLCLFRTYGDGGAERRCCGEAVIDGLAYLYCRLLYEYAVRFHAVVDADADAGMPAAAPAFDDDVAVV